ncbi:protein PLANT CADMIUM RESISTANCE 2-like [Chenopodium quinoa]|uniref:protein PLANT CADMIUM RESISTANCE 2-like n=1 Tax=Chenopodium quinoa TaxID=63459 RepID=UPI000B7889FE|nr:protein PLANT CADMIUM RESISTANCE 2-like [Chenopodium quinoa]
MTPRPIQTSQASPPLSPSKISHRTSPSLSPSRISHAQLSFSTNIPQGSPHSSTQTPQESPRSGKQMRQRSSSSAQSTPSPGNVPLSYPPPPTQTPINATTTVEWSTGLCACHSDITNCCVTFCCPCITFGQITDIVDKGTSSCAVNGTVYAVLAIVLRCACFYSAIYRRRMRLQFNLKGSTLGDCCIHSFCEICALSQEYRELHLRGFDLGLGWQANIDRQNQAAITTPPPHESMRR